MWKLSLDVECVVCKKTLTKIVYDPRKSIMGKIINRRSRTPNWSTEEKHYLLELIKENREVVIKANNGPNQAEDKCIAWNDILRKLTAKFGSKFTDFSIKKLKTQWQNMRRIAREEVAHNGDQLQKYTKLSLDVCDVLRLIQNGALKKENGNEITISDIEIKTESIDEEMNDASYESNSFMNNQSINLVDKIDESPTTVVVDEISNSSSVRYRSTSNETNKKSVDTMTDISADSLEKIIALRENLEDLIRCADSEKQLKLESMKDQRQIMKAMRETAELNKIVAEQKLKHVLWLKKHNLAMYSGEPGSGAGKGGGGGGAIREAGGAFGKMEAAREDEYFYKKQKEQLSNLKGHLDKEIAFHQEQIKRHEDAIRRHKQQMAEIPEEK